MNNVKTTVLLVGLTALLVWLGSLVGGTTGAVIAFLIALGINGFAYWGSDKLVLRMYGAHEVTRADAPELYRIVEELVQRARIPMPRVYIIPDKGLNAFATGRNPQHAAIAVTEGLLRALDPREIAAVVAHELAHVKHRDILIGTVAATIVGAVTMISNWAQWGAMFGQLHSDDDERGGNVFVVLLVAMVSAFAATLIQLAISRSREYEADAGAARLLGEAGPLISALRKLDYASQRVPVHASEATAHMFIVSPLFGGGVRKLFSTHPAIEDRIRALESLRPGLVR
jgi:heat shock protein HtpX